MIRNDDLCGSFVLVESDLFDTGRAQGLSDQALGVVTPFNDIDLLPAEFIHDLSPRRARAPTQAPHGDDVGSFEATAILVRWRGSRAIARISTSPSTSSGTSSSNSDRMNSG